MLQKQVTIQYAGVCLHIDGIAEVWFGSVFQDISQTRTRYGHNR